MTKLRTAGKFYTRIMMKNIGIFIFVGLLSVVFHDHGWFSNENMYAISQFVYQNLLPALIAWEGGAETGGTEGGILGVLAVSGILASGSSFGIFAALLAGPLCGFLWKRLKPLVEDASGFGFQMLVRNLCLGMLGGGLAAAGYYLVSPVLNGCGTVLYHCIRSLDERGMTVLLHVVIEPAKVFFLNNLMNYTILVPLGMGQVQEAGKSILFLVEANPGPGMGVLAALLYMNRKRICGTAEGNRDVLEKKREEYLASLAAQAAGGIHEVYFPFVLSNLRLLIPLILGGMAGTLWFSISGAGARGVIAPGSAILMVVMGGKDGALPILAGILISGAVTFLLSIQVLKMGQKEKNHDSEVKEVPLKEKRIGKIVFVCDGGMGSSAMGAALFRRLAAGKGVQGITVEAHPADMVPEDADLVVCQKDFYEMLPAEWKDREVYTVQSLVKTDEYHRLLEELQNRNG